MKFLISIFFIFCSVAGFAKDFHSCDQHLNTDDSVNPTKGFIAYLQRLASEKIITANDLQKFSEDLAKNKFNNFLKYQEIVTSEKSVHANLVQDYVDNSDLLDKNAIQQWVGAYLKDQASTQVEKNKVQQETHLPFIPMRFHRIEPGYFKMSRRLKEDKPHYVSYSAELTEPFEAMETVVTQWMWYDLMGELPDGLGKNIKDSITIFKNGKSVSFQPDYPITGVTWWSVLEFANRLSRLHGLKEAYDLSDVQFRKDEKAENGSWFYKSGRLKINAPGENIYLTEGYRLPTEAEQEFMMTDRGRRPNTFAFGLKREEYDQYICFFDKAKPMVKVGSAGNFKPFFIDGKPFYDLFGNVAQWSHDIFKDHQTVESTLIKGGKNPVHFIRGDYRIVRGGHYFSQDWQLHCGTRESVTAGAREYTFRLVRSLPK